jgi:hypothetical protein
MTPSPRGRRPEGSHDRPEREFFWRQHSPFTCGPAALGNILYQISGNEPENPLIDEIEIWRESTALVCPGSHPYGLAIAAVRRGFHVRVEIAGDRPWLGKHIRSEHGGHESMAAYEAIEQQLLLEGLRLGIRIHPNELARIRPGEDHGLMLVDARMAGEAHSDPHWIGLVSVGPRVRVLDPLRESMYLSSLGIESWWRRSGFGGSKAWIAIHR